MMKIRTVAQIARRHLRARFLTESWLIVDPFAILYEKLSQRYDTEGPLALLTLSIPLLPGLRARLQGRDHIPRGSSRPALPRRKHRLLHIAAPTPCSALPKHR